MIDENQIMPFNFFKYGGIYTGGHNSMRYKLERVGQKPDFSLEAMVWQGPYASDSVDKASITSKVFDYSEEGRSEAILWLKQMYNDRIDEWNNAPSINKADIIMNSVKNQ